MNKLFILLGLLVISCAEPTAEVSQADLDDWESFKAKRLANLKLPDGFLNLAGLYWLEEGENTFGSDSTNNILFPNDLPEVMGNFRLKEKTVTILNPTEGLTIDTLTATETVVFDLDSSVVKIMEYGTYRWFIIERAGDVGIRLINLDHPKLKETIDIKHFDYNPKLAVQAEFISYTKPKKLKIINVLDHEFEMDIVGQLKFEIDGKAYTLEPIEDGDRFFIIFSDGTSAIETYGSGRYLYADKPTEGGLVDLNFNRAYNPPCAFTEFATCLIPPPENRLDLRVEAGELDYHVE